MKPILPLLPSVLTAAALATAGPGMAGQSTAGQSLILSCTGDRTQDAAQLCADFAAQLVARGFTVSQSPASVGRRIELVTEQVSATVLHAQIVLDEQAKDAARRLTLSVAGRPSLPREDIQSFAHTLIEMSGLLSR